MLRKWLRRLPGYRWLIIPLIRRDYWRDSPDDARRRHFYGEFAGAGDLVFDVGANMGNRSKTFLQLGARVIAFEPQQECVNYLRAAVGRHPGFTLVTEALGDRQGEARLLIGDTHVISTLSPAWQAATTASGRFGAARWERSQQVSMTTLASAIAAFGLPRFVKIDVEGFEFEVVSTLTRPVAGLSVEFTTEYLESTLRCVAHFETLADDNRYQLSLEESLDYFLPEWESVAGVLAALRNLPRDAWGDLYVKMGPARAGAAAR